jgi:SAM-dependent methyltransferase
MSPETAGLVLLLVILIAIFLYLAAERGIGLLAMLRKQSALSMEGFDDGNRFNKRILWDDPSKFYDDYYVERIDQAYYPEGKNVCRCSDLYKSAFLRMYPREKTRVLLVGANTGRFLDALTGVCPEVTGLVRFPKLKDIAQRIAPKARVMLADAAADDELFPTSTFTHVIFEDRSLYEFHDHNQRKKAIENAIKWLEPGGRLVIRVVDREKFDPMIPTAVPLRGLNIQNYLSQRKQDSKVFFRDGSRIETNFTPIPSEDRAVFREDLYDKTGSLMRTQIHRWSIPQKDAIIEEVSRMGVEHDQSVSLAPCTSPNESYEIFVKGEYRRILGE